MIIFAFEREDCHIKVISPLFIHNFLYIARVAVNFLHYLRIGQIISSALVCFIRLKFFIILSQHFRVVNYHAWSEHVPVIRNVLSDCFHKRSGESFCQCTVVNIVSGKVNKSAWFNITFRVYVNILSSSRYAAHHLGAVTPEVYSEHRQSIPCVVDGFFDLVSLICIRNKVYIRTFADWYIMEEPAPENALVTKHLHKFIGCDIISVFSCCCNACPEEDACFFELVHLFHNHIKAAFASDCVILLFPSPKREHRMNIPEFLKTFYCLISQKRAVCKCDEGTIWKLFCQLEKLRSCKRFAADNRYHMDTHFISCFFEYLAPFVL